MVIDILLQSTAWFNKVKQHWPWLVLGWVTVLVCQFLLGWDFKPRSLALFLRWQHEIPLGIDITQFSFFTPPRNRGWVIFSLQFVSLCVCVCLSVCLCVRKFLWTKFQPSGCIDLDAVFAKWLLPALARTLLILVTLGQRSRSLWRYSHFFFIILC